MQTPKIKIVGRPGKQVEGNCYSKYRRVFGVWVKRGKAAE
jgi:hypothetical protein